MATPALPTLLQPSVVNERISRLRVINNTLQNHFGMQAGGPNVRRSPSGRRGAYDVFNDTREVATARLPGATSATIARNPRGTVAFSIPRIAEKKPLLMEELSNLRPLGGPTNVVDQMGELFIADEETINRQRVTNAREFQVAAMLRGSYTYTQTGDDLVHGFSGGGVTINYQIPTGNKSQLNMLGGGDIIGTSWDNAAAPISTDLFQINAAFIQLTGRGLTDVWVTSVVWANILANTQLLAQAGTVNRVFEFIEKNEETEEFTAKLNAIPWVTFHITDNGLNLAGTFTKLIPDTAAVFATRQGPQVAKYYECGEPVVVEWTRQSLYAQGEYYYYDLKGDPACYVLHSIFNGIPVLFIPASIAFGTVVF